MTSEGNRRPPLTNDVFEHIELHYYHPYSQLHDQTSYTYSTESVVRSHSSADTEAVNSTSWTSGNVLKFELNVVNTESQCDLSNSVRNSNNLEWPSNYFTAHRCKSTFSYICAKTDDRCCNWNDSFTISLPTFTASYTVRLTLTTNVILLRQGVARSLLPLYEESVNWHFRLLK